MTTIYIGGIDIDEVLLGLAALTDAVIIDFIDDLATHIGDSEFDRQLYLLGLSRYQED